MFKKQWLNIFSCLVFCCAHSMVWADQPDSKQPNTFLGPIAALSVISAIGPDSAYDLSGELGKRDGRIALTLGWNIGDNQRFKASADYLWQHIAYGFYAGNSSFWAQQGSVSAAYQYDIDARFQPQVGFNAYLSLSPSKNVGLFVGEAFTNNRRATGSRGLGFSPTLSVSPWAKGLFTGELNYDRLGYDNDYPVFQNAAGLGGTLRFAQAFTAHVGVDLSAAVRVPFNQYAASLHWTSQPAQSWWRVGVFGEYVAGKYTLPTTYNAGLSLDYFYDHRETEASSASLKNEIPPVKKKQDYLLAWTSSQAVRLPEVYTVKDEEVVSSGVAG